MNVGDFVFDMPKKYTQDEIVRRFIKVHGDNFDYSDVIYRGIFEDVTIHCRNGHTFTQTPDAHQRGQGCPYCKAINKRRLKYGVGITDVLNAQHEKSYSIWNAMLSRCYNPISIKTDPTYIGCTVCNEWLTFSNFKRWFDENYVEGYQLDKDILVKGNKIYSPDTCCFVPKEINTLLTYRKRNNSGLPIGIARNNKRFMVKVHINNRQTYIGTFDSMQEASEAYIKAKESNIKRVATLYYDKGKITEKVYIALMNWKV